MANKIPLVTTSLRAEPDGRSNGYETVVVKNSQCDISEFLHGMGVAYVIDQRVNPLLGTDTPYLLLACDPRTNDVRLGIPRNIPGDYIAAINKLFDGKCHPIEFARGKEESITREQNFVAQLEKIRLSFATIEKGVVISTGNLHVETSSNTLHINQPFIEHDDSKPYTVAEGFNVTITSEKWAEPDGGHLVFNIKNVGYMMIDLENPGRFKLSVILKDANAKALAEKLSVLAPHSDEIAEKWVKEKDSAQLAGNHPQSFGFDFDFELDRNSSVELANQLERVVFYLPTQVSAFTSDEYGISLDTLIEATRHQTHSVDAMSRD